VRLADYKCEECDHVIEDIEAKDGEEFPKRKKCPACGKMTCHRIWSAVVKVPNDFDTSSRQISGAKKYKKEMQKYNGLREKGNKRFY
jgi:hypothetical protein